MEKFTTSAEGGSSLTLWRRKGSEASELLKLLPISMIEAVSSVVVSSQNCEKYLYVGHFILELKLESIADYIEWVKKEKRQRSLVSDLYP